MADGSLADLVPIQSNSTGELFVQACLEGVPEDAHGFLKDLDQVIESVVAPSAAAVDEESAHPEAALEALSGIRALGVQIPKAYGGLGYGNEVAALVVERTARACASTAAVLMFHYQVVNRTMSFAHPARRADDLARFADRTLTASAWTESTGKAKDAPETALSQAGSSGVIDGVKTFCTGLRSASVIDVLLSADFGGRKGPTFVRVDTERAGVDIAEIYSMLGLRGTGTGAVELRGVPVRGTDILGPVGSAPELMRRNHRTPLNPGLIAMGIASAAYEDALRICRGESEGIPARHSRPEVRRTLAEAAVSVEQTYAYAAHLVRCIAADPESSHVPASKLKVQATAAAESLTRRLLPVVGSHGFLSSFPMERHMRDAEATALMGPTGDLCLSRVAASLLPGE
ncbi:acyl-CoA dehydrogenase family protein [Streptomyces sp. NPDC058469]|uniref:acyl-CoA dehydrogenase family protein n=1 Tax=Streptomyces sp. NPDC058469 TaxID=3346514 RepID=UPI0036646EF6